MMWVGVVVAQAYLSAVVVGGVVAQAYLSAWV